MTKQLYFTEWLSAMNAKDLKLHIYKMQLTDLENRYSELARTISVLRRNNHFLPIVYNDLFIASFYEIKNWHEVINKFIGYEIRRIDLLNLTERTLLEKLIKANIQSVNQDQYILDGSGFKSRKIYRTIGNQIRIFQGLHIDVHVNETGEIRVGFDRRFRFEFVETLNDILMRDRRELKVGDKVIDYNNRRTYEYEFIEVAGYVAGENSPYLNTSVKEYYESTNQAWKIKNIPDDALIVHVRNKDRQILPYIAQFLKRKCDYGSIPNHLRQSVNRVIKLNPEKRMKPLLAEIYQLLLRVPNLKFPKEQVLAKKAGYKKKYLKGPSLEFGSGISRKNILSGLKAGGVYARKSIPVSFFVDPSLHSKADFIYQFIMKLQRMSENLNVDLKISKKPQQIREMVTKNLFRSADFTLKLKDIGTYFDGTVVVITTRNNIDLAYKKVKREFGGKLDITTQFVEFDEKLLNDRAYGVDYHLHNILLGIYAKSGVQAWILGTRLSSDCFIGLDVSHIEGRHSSGIIQVIGKDGRLIKQTTTSTHESGEKISAENLKEVVEDSLHAYKNMYGFYPKHITFHRDGVCRENLEELDNRLSSLHIKFDYVEIIKNSNRRMVTYQNNSWFTEQGLYYKRGQTAYLCATDPRESVGMAQPIKIEQKTNVLPFDFIVKDVYLLSFMHVHSLLKTRLPITTHYADT